MLSIKFVPVPNGNVVEHIHYNSEDSTPIRNVAWCVTEIQADNDELVHIQRMFYEKMNIPLPNRTVCRWYGDYAKMIVGNW